MKAVRAHHFGEPEGLSIDEIDRPEPQPGQVLIKVRAAALNFPDVLMVKGDYQVKPDLPYTPGFELCGTVESVGQGVTGVAPGDRVMAQCDCGAFAEYTVAPVQSVHAAPEALTDAQAAAFLLVYQTSYFGLLFRGQLRAARRC